MYRRTFSKLHHRPLVKFGPSSTYSLGVLGTRVRKRAFQSSHSVNAIDRRGARLRTSKKARSQAGNFQHTRNTRRQLDTKDIIVDNLQATLEAHRATNRATVVRRLYSEVQSTIGIYRPPLDDARCQKQEPEHEAANTRPVKGDWEIQRDRGELWPANSPQGQRSRTKWHEKGGNAAEKDNGGYVAKNFRPQGYWQIKFGEDMQRPWLAHMDGHDGDGLMRLEAEVRAHESYMKLTAAEKMACQLLIKEITSIAGKALPRNPLKVIGSHRTGLATPTSDIDFSLSMPEYEKKDPTVRGPSSTRPEARKARNKKLFILENALLKSGQFVDVRFVYARVPIVTALHRRTGLKINIQGLNSTSASRTCVAAYLSEYPTLRPLYVLLRSALDIRLLTTVFEGGFGSYTIFMMIVNALKHASIPSSTGDGIKRHDLPAQLFWVLDFYASADLCQTGYSVDPPGVFRKVEMSPGEGRRSRGSTRKNKLLVRKKAALSPSPPETVTVWEFDPQQPYLLCLQDPANPLNDLGSKSYSIMHVQETFRQASEKLKRMIEFWDTMHTDERKVWPGSLLDALVGAYYGHFVERRRILANGAGQAEEGGSRGGRREPRVPIQFRAKTFVASRVGKHSGRKKA